MVDKSNWNTDFIEYSDKDISDLFRVTGEDAKLIGYRINGLTKKLLDERNFSESTITDMLNKGEYDGEVRMICPHYKYWNAMSRMCCDLTLRVCSSVSCLLYYIYKDKKENGSD